MGSKRSFDMAGMEKENITIMGTKEPNQMPSNQTRPAPSSPPPPRPAPYNVIINEATQRVVGYSVPKTDETYHVGWSGGIAGGKPMNAKIQSITDKKTVLDDLLTKAKIDPKNYLVELTEIVKSELGISI